MRLSRDGESRKGGVSEFDRGSLWRLKHNCTYWIIELLSLFFVEFASPSCTSIKCNDEKWGKEDKRGINSITVAFTFFFFYFSISRFKRAPSWKSVAGQNSNKHVNWKLWEVNVRSNLHDGLLLIMVWQWSV